MPAHQFFDKLTLDVGNRTKDGYLTATVKAARSGIQLYTGADLGMPDRQVVRVYRPPEEVFHKDALHSYAYRPVVVDHPIGDVTADNWRDLARGMTGGEIARDGDFVRVPLALMDAETIGLVASGKNQVSMGYTAELEFVDGTTPAGEPYDAIQRKQRMNHLAIVSSARGGSDLRIGDDNHEEDDDMPNRMVMVDGLSVETTDQGAQAIEKLLADRKAARDAATADATAKDATITQLRADIAKKDGETAVMKKQIEDGKMTPQKLDEAVVSRAALITDAKKIAGDDIVTTGKTDAEIRRAAIVHKLGDEAAKALDDAAIAGAFAYAAKDAGTTQPNGSGVQVLRTALSDTGNKNARAEADKSWDTYKKSLEDGYKTQVPEKAAAA